MRIFLIDPEEDSRRTLVVRVEEAIRQSGLRRIETLEGDLDLIEVHAGEEPPALAFLGPGCYHELEHSLSRFRAAYPLTPLALVLDNEIYANEAVELRRLVSVRIMPLADIAQIAQFMLDSGGKLAGQPGAKNRGIVGVAQFKGGVGATTIAVGLAGCWARHDLSVVLIDFDDVNPQITDWGRIGVQQRIAVSEMLRDGELPKYRVNELVSPIEGYNGRLVVIGQPEDYREGFHFKADVLEGAPSSADFVRSLLTVLQDEFDVIVIDFGRSWGISTFAALPLCQHVILATDDDGFSVRRTLEGLRRLYRESDDPEEFDLSRWRIVLNAYTGKQLSPNDVADEIEALDIFPESTSLYTVPFSEHGRQWGASGASFYDAAEEPVKAILRELAFNLVPFRQAAAPSGAGKLWQRWQKLVR